MLEYSAYVILSRAIPDIRSGLKPVQKRLLYTMHRMNLYNNNRRKSVKVDSDTIGDFHPHGGTYEALARMTDEAEILSIPFVKGEGSFGKVYSKVSAAAPRYTEVSLLPIVKEAFENINKHNIFRESYDGRNKEPETFMFPFPNILANADSGIGYGFASNFGSFNLNELIDFTLGVIEGKSEKDLYKLMNAPDFTTGARVSLEDGELEKIFKDGTGRVELRAKVEVDKKNHTLNIKEIPYNTTIEAIIDKIDKEYDNKKLLEIVDRRDEIGADGFGLAIEYKKGTDPNNLINKLYALTPLKTYFNFNMTVIHNNRPVRLGVFDIVKHWIDFRKDWVQEEVNYDIVDKSAKLQLLKALEKVLLDLDKAVEIVKNSKTDKEVIENIKKHFKIDDKQAEYVAEIKLRNFNKDYILNKTRDIKGLEKEIKDLKNADITELVKQGLELSRKYSTERLTEVVQNFKEIKPIESEEVKGKSIIFTGNIDRVRRHAENSTASTPDGMQKSVVDNNSKLLVFTNLGRVIKVPIYEIKENAFQTSSDFLGKKELGLGEVVLFTTPLIPENDLIIVFSNDKVARFTLEVYNNSGIRHKNGFNIESTPVYFEAIDEEREISFGNRTLNTNKYKTKGTRMTKGVNI